MSRASRGLSVLLLLAFLAPRPVGAGEVVDVVTYYPSPDGDFRDVRVTGALQVGSAGNIAVNGFQLLGTFTIANNDLNGWQVGTSGGGLIVRDSLNVRNAGGTSLFYVNETTDRVGIGTTAPDAPLDVRGQVNTLILHGYNNLANPYTGTLAEVLHQNFSPFDARNGLAGVTGQPGVSLRFTYVYIDGDPIVFQNEAKVGAFEGPVVINGDQFDPNGYTNLHNLIVGGTAAPKKARAQAWDMLSSASAKTDLTPLGPEQSDRIYQQMSRTPLYTYRYQAEPENAKRHTGYIAEESPPILITSHPTTVDVNQAAYALAVSVSELAKRQRGLSERLEALER
ncbi:MAG: hypothetical protein MOGMAGMI_00971 [Candidatus Omnitrophica bacterium]|nr:hypothetical protein [Candidatus Omnitrophota bacterium]